MKRSAFTLLFAALVAGSVMLPHAAEARRGRAVGAFVGGFAAGTLFGGVMMPPAYVYPPYYYPPYAYPSYAYAPLYYGYRPRCFCRHEARWNGHRWYRARVLVCH